MPNRYYLFILFFFFFFRAFSQDTMLSAVNLFNKACDNIYFPKKTLNVGVELKTVLCSDTSYKKEVKYNYHYRKGVFYTLVSPHLYSVLRDSAYYLINELDKTILIQHQKDLIETRIIKQEVSTIKSVKRDSLKSGLIQYTFYYQDDFVFDSLVFVYNTKSKAIQSYLAVINRQIEGNDGNDMIAKELVKVIYNYNIEPIPAKRYKMQFVKSLKDDKILGLKDFEKYEIFDFYHD